MRLFHLVERVGDGLRLALADGVFAGDKPGERAHLDDHLGRQIELGKPSRAGQRLALGAVQADPVGQLGGDGGDPAGTQTHRAEAVLKGQGAEAGHERVDLLYL